MNLVSCIFLLSIMIIFSPPKIVKAQLQYELYTLNSVSKNDWISSIVGTYSNINDEFSCATKCNMNVCNAWMYDKGLKTCALANVFLSLKAASISKFTFKGYMLDPNSGV